MPSAPSDRVLRPRGGDIASETHNLVTAMVEAAQEVFEFGDSHFHSSMPFTQTSKLATPEEMAESYLKEKQNWSDAEAFKLVTKAELPRGANVIGSHVIYKYNSNGSLKARIVPHGHMDDEKAFMRTDAPTMSTEVMRLLISVVAERGWRIGSLDVKAAYLQADGFNRDIFVRPPSEEGDSKHLWRLE
jgi:Reverse transcriptase (RNA-dependent DNA polymerase)